MWCNHKDYDPNCSECREYLRNKPYYDEAEKIQALIGKYEEAHRNGGLTEVCRQLVKNGDVK